VFACLISLTFSIVPSGFWSSLLSFLGNIWFSIWTWHSVISSIQFILKYLTLFPSSINSLSLSSTPTSPIPGQSWQTWSYMANSMIFLLSSLLLSPFIPAPSRLVCWGILARHSNMAECIWWRVVSLGPVASKNHSSLGYEYSRCFVNGSGIFPRIWLGIRNLSCWSETVQSWGLPQVSLP
jgi:hypothetical protein